MPALPLAARLTKALKMNGTGMLDCTVYHMRWCVQRKGTTGSACTCQPLVTAVDLAGSIFEIDDDGIPQPIPLF